MHVCTWTHMRSPLVINTHTPPQPHSPQVTHIPHSAAWPPAQRSPYQQPVVGVQGPSLLPPTVGIHQEAVIDSFQLEFGSSLLLGHAQWGPVWVEEGVMCVRVWCGVCGCGGVRVLGGGYGKVCSGLRGCVVERCIGQHTLRVQCIVQAICCTS